ncbi:porin [Piscinibacter gummiphilus]|uniref:Porin n=1 Tax=Piscinibacter gummiphilus TaxID=946333 RepID=A0ABZ0CLY0_9BURK|nr:porin [Piscinibacter gummiphilus]WOB05975.1 porin [Piscinibacter gummiphilus]
MKCTSAARAAVALAGALAAVGASAQSSVTIFGGVDGNVTRVRSEGRGSMWQVRDAGNYVTKIGFTGNEDLGGGYRAHFYLESQASSDTGNGVPTNTNNRVTGSSTGGGLTWNRKATVSLFTPMGEVRFGRDYTPPFAPVAYFDPWGTAGVGSSVNHQPIYKGTLALPTLVRVSNSVAYHIPRSWVNGLQVYVQGAAGEGTGPRFMGIGSTYLNGPLLVAGGISRTDAPLTDMGTALTAPTVSSDNKLMVWSLGAWYTLPGNVKIMGFRHSQTLDRYGSLATPSIGTELDREVTDSLVGVSWGLSTYTLKASYVLRDDKGRENADSRQIALGVTNNLSKRTAVYVTAVQIENKNTASYNYISSGFNPVAGGTARAIQAGIAHNF